MRYPWKYKDKHKKWHQSVIPPKTFTLTSSNQHLVSARTYCDLSKVVEALSWANFCLRTSFFSCFTSLIHSPSQWRYTSFFSWPLPPARWPCSGLLSGVRISENYRGSDKCPAIQDTVIPHIHHNMGVATPVLTHNTQLVLMGATSCTNNPGRECIFSPVEEVACLTSRLSRQ
jgi:hypothetical protein